MSAALPEAGDLFVAPAGNDAWSGALPEPAADGSDGPLATPLAAQRAVRRLLASADVPRPLTVWLRGGRYELPAPLGFGPEDSGPVTWSAFPGERPVLSGGRRLTGWQVTEHEGRTAWTTVVPRSPDQALRSLFVDGRRAERPRWPVPGGEQDWLRLAGYDAIDLVGQVDAATEQLFAGGDRVWVDPSDLPALSHPTEVELLVTHYWVEQRMPIASYDAESGEVRSSRRSSMRLVEDWRGVPARYYLDNVLEGLQQPGQWYWESDTGRLTYLPLPGQDPETTVVVAPVARQLLRLEDARWLRFEGLSFTETDWDVVTAPASRWHVHGFEASVDYASTGQSAVDTPGVLSMERSEHIALERCEVRGTGWYGVEIGRGCRSIALRACRLSDLGGGGVKVEGADAEGPRADRVSGVLVEDCEITRGGMVTHAAVGVIVVEGSDIRLVHNEIADFDYSGVSLGFVWGYPQTATYDNLVEGCHIHHIGRGRLSDLGGIYTLGVQPGTTLRGNVIHDVVSAHYGAGGIYLDEGSSHLVVEHNVVYGIETAALQVHYGRENTLRHNVLSGGDQGPVLLIRAEDHQAFTLERNILLTDRGDWFPVGAGYAAQDPAAWPVTSDLNLLWGDGSPELSPAWLAAGKDVHSVVADPGFVDPKRPELGLTPGSPAEQVGFRPYDWSTVGPRRPVGPT